MAFIYLFMTINVCANLLFSVAALFFAPVHFCFIFRLGSLCFIFHDDQRVHELALQRGRALFRPR
jgi:hypothetical protein